MKPLHALDSGEAQQLRGVLFDLDGTLLTQGVLSRAAFDAMWALYDEGLVLGVVTGRPSGWCGVLATMWPVRGCVAENGAIAWVREGDRIVCRDTCPPAERVARRGALEKLAERVRSRVPEARLADDNDARHSDIAWDVGEHESLPADRVGAIVDEIERAGARAVLSSVHLHATFDGYDKASGAVRFCARELGEDPARALVRFAFVGDSGNDAPCFGAFRTSFGVANVKRDLLRLTMGPRYVASRPMGDGFAEIAETILAKRGRRAPA